jgi:hypothetical protein
MRPIGLVLMVLGFALLPASCFYLFGSTFAPTGRSLVEREPLELPLAGDAREQTFRVRPGARYQFVTSLSVSRGRAPIDTDAGAYVLTYDVPAHLELFDPRARDDAPPLLDQRAPVTKGGADVHEFDTSTVVLGDARVERPFDWFVAPASGLVLARASIGPPVQGGSQVAGATLLLYSDVVRSAKSGILGVVLAVLTFALGVFLFIYGHARTLRRRGGTA